MRIQAISRDPTSLLTAVATVHFFQWLFHTIHGPPGLLFSSVIMHAVGRAPWASDQPD
jgi:hypothetical protein